MSQFAVRSICNLLEVDLNAFHSLYLWIFIKCFPAGFFQRGLVSFRCFDQQHSRPVRSEFKQPEHDVGFQFLIQV